MGNSIKRKRVDGLGAEMGELVDVLAALSLGGLWAGGPANAPHKERQAAANNTSISSSLVALLSCSS